MTSPHAAAITAQVGCRQQRSLHVVRRLLCGAALLCLLAITGCASITNPLANGVPARLVPDDLLAEPKINLQPIPLTWLRTKPPERYVLDTGDVLGVYIEGVLGESDQLPPINFPDVSNLPPSVGFPIPIREDGTVPLPLIKPVDVKGLSISEAQDKILSAYTVEKEIIKAEEARVLVTLVRPRTIKIRVVREDSASGPSTGGYSGGFGNYAPIFQRGAGRGTIVELPETEADLLSVLADTGGLPGPDAANEVIIQRGYRDTDEKLGSANEFAARLDACGETGWGAGSNEAWPDFARIPLRWYPNESPPFKPEDVKLRDGDVVYIPALDVQVYYTGGLLPPREVPLPRDYDLGVVEALLRVGGPLVSGGFNANNFGGGLGQFAGIGQSSPSLLSVVRRAPDGRLVNIRVNLNRAVQDPRENILIHPGDVLILQQTPQEAIFRYLGDIVNFTFIGRLFEGQSGSGTATIVVP